MAEIQQYISQGDLVSIIMPVFNGGAYLRRAVDSVLGQLHENWELLIVDDGSGDDSLAIARSYADPRIKVFTQESRGVSAARNAGLKEMRGDFFCFLDADDQLPPRSISARLQCFDRDDVAFADGSVEVFNKDFSLILRKWVPRCRDDHFRSLIHLDGKCFFGPTWMIRRYPSVTFRFDEDLRHGEELFFYMTYAQLGMYSFTDEVVLRYRHSDDSAMSNLSGLALGYELLAKKLMGLQGVRQFDRFVFNLKTRKIMFLSFLRAGNVWNAFSFLVRGTIK